MCPTEFCASLFNKGTRWKCLRLWFAKCVERECAFEYFIVSFGVMTNNCYSVNNYNE